MDRLLILYFLGYLTVQTILVIWFYSPFRISLGQVLFDREMFTFDQFETHLLIRSAILGKLLSCYICFSFWISLLIGVFLTAIGVVPLYFPAVTAMTYPAICYLYHSLTNKS